jgi:SAM-dependent methyltransferase
LRREKDIPERLYTDHPELYDVIHSDWDYDRDVSFITNAFARHGIDCHHILEIGCGTGEHTRRLVAEGFDVTGVDKYTGMLSLAREKCDANFRQSALPDLDMNNKYGAIVAIRDVVNHLSPEQLKPALQTLERHLADRGILIFDNSPLPPDGNAPGIDIGTTEQGDYARIAHHASRDDGCLDWNTITFAPSKEIVNTRTMSPFADNEIYTILSNMDVTVERNNGYGSDSYCTVFVAVR